MTPVAEAHGAAVAYSGRRVLHGVDLEVRAGEVLALLGANGSGKSTMVRALVGLLPVSRGEVRLFGTPLPRFHDWHRIGYVPQRITAASGVPATVQEVVAGGRLSRRPWWRPPTKADWVATGQALATVGLAEKARAGVASLSGGQQQRVLIARALAGDPELLVMDEPLAGVDLPSQEAFATTLQTLADEGRTLLLVAHELGPLEPLVDRAVVLRAGRVVYDGPPPPAAGHHAQPGHDHVHPHAGPPPTEPRWFP